MDPLSLNSFNSKKKRERRMKWRVFSYHTYELEIWNLIDDNLIIFLFNEALRQKR